MSERIYILDERGNVCGIEDRNFVHNNGILHLAVQCWLINESREVLIQRRSAKKDRSPGKWDVSFGGHCCEVNDNQDILIKNLLKEGKEELGISLSPTQPIKLGEIRYTSQNNQNREILAVFLVHIDSKQQFVFEDGEVQETKWITIEELHDNIIQNPTEYANRLAALSLLNFYKSAT